MLEPQGAGQAPDAGAPRARRRRRRLPGLDVLRGPVGLVALSLALTVLGVLEGLALSRALGPRWEAGATVAFSSVSADPLLSVSPNASLIERDTADASALALSQLVLEPARESLGEASWEDLQASVTVTPQPGSSILTIAATASDPGVASARVDAVTRSLAEVLRRRLVDAANEAAAAASRSAATAPPEQRAALGEIAAKAAVVAGTADPVQVLTVEAAAQIRPAPLRDAATGGVLGLLLASVVLVLLRVRPSRIINSQDAGELLGLPAGTLRSGAVAPDSEVLVDDLRRLAERSADACLVVVPAGPDGVAAAQEVAAALTSRGQPADSRSAAGGVRSPRAPRVVVTGDPLASVVEPLVRDAGAVVLAVAAGSPARVVRAVHRLCAEWDHRPDAVIVAG